MKIYAKCINNVGYEWLLSNGYSYDVCMWTGDTIGIVHPTCGIYGLSRERFDFISPSRYGLISFDYYKSFKRIKYLNSNFENSDIK